MYKNLTDQTCIYDEVYLKHIVHEKLNTMKWDMTGNSKEFLGYNCREAKTTWRGRVYIAYFTTELPFKSAPWKFHNLPGVLLKVYTEDEKFNISATSIRIGVDLGTIANPFKFKNSISWDKHCEEYKASQKRSIERLKVLNIKNGYNITYGGGRIELFTDADIKYDQNSENQKK
ncbi:GLPGLI family protein [Flavobacteriaceae bacterium F08102]|nr:GLPGLI family protein [Flavobacteriaceae bacterium F08102]